jgi:GMP synthase (glutamine-hydrolysing)
MSEIHEHKILILDYGSQYTQLIARRIRELKVYCEIHPFNYSVEHIIHFNPRGIILSGGPASVYQSGAPLSSPAIFDLGIPILGICYGMQLMTHQLGGEVARSGEREYGYSSLIIDDERNLLKGFSDGEQVWMSHGDRINVMPEGFEVLAHTKSSPVAAMKHKRAHLYGVQFHPEVAHTPRGMTILSNFVFSICGAEPVWNMASFIQESIRAIRRQVNGSRIICALSGGVDSSVTAALVHRAVGGQLTCIFVDNGLLRAGEAKEVLETFGSHFKVDLRFVRAEKRFLEKLKGVEDPEQKRRIIGREFIEVFEEEAHKLGEAKFLAQGTLYPDVIESVSFQGPSATIKTHHNVGGLPEAMNLELVEPLRELFKDEVRLLGRELGLPQSLLGRHPFPGPGLAIRVLADVTPERLEILRKADTMVLEEMKRFGYYDKVWQAFAVFLPVRTVGVMGDERTYENVIALRVVESQDAMTADWAKLPYQLLETISNRIINEVRGINRVVYDISSKPPSTIEWE